ncbi:MAG TPA: Gfo/Idh/MocA family oxidoreductase [Candidatus Binatia bacterium]|jgi:predicted dehydrogenase|nr:Gfo/Idh/MocA family oxidoreductase [Candidatus Binatia bacterium]
MNEKKVRYAVIGCGEHALRGHAIPGKEVPNLELVALCDPSQDQMLKFEEAYGAPLDKRTSEKDVLADPGVDAVLIASPDRFHAESLFDAIFAGKHALCEKPLATDRHDLQAVVTALARAGEKGLVVTSCHPRRCDPPFLWVKEHLPSFVDQYGPVIGIDFDFSYHKPGKQGLHVGLLMDHINHEYDLMNFLFGRSKATARKLVDSQTRYHAVGIRKDGIAFSFAGTRLLERRVYPEYCRLRFERGSLEVDCGRGVAEVRGHDTGATTPRYAGETDYRLRFVAVMANFAASVLGAEANYLAHEDLLGNTEIGIALTEGDAWTSH